LLVIISAIPVIGIIKKVRKKDPKNKIFLKI